MAPPILVLVAPQDIVNIGSAVRIAKNFGLAQVRLVAPEVFDAWRIEGIAHNTADMIERITIHDTLADAVKDCVWTVALTARERTAKRTVYRPGPAAAELVQKSELGPVAFVAGREDKGLSNDELDQCHALVTIPTNPEYKSPFLRAAAGAKAVGFIVVTTDKGLCGGLNTNVLRAVTNKMKEVQAAGGSVQAVAIGNKGLGFLNRIGAPVLSHATQLGDAPQLEKLIGPVKVMLDAFVEGKLDAVWLCYTKFINTMKQEPVVEQLLPLAHTRLEQSAAEKKAYGWDYIYEPDAPSVIDELLTRYIEALVYQSVAENMASEQSARMVAMKAATDNAGKIINELQLIYNKTRQAAITKELSEIVGGLADLGHRISVVTNFSASAAKLADFVRAGRGRVGEPSLVESELQRHRERPRLRRRGRHLGAGRHRPPGRRQLRGAHPDR